MDKTIKRDFGSQLNYLFIWNEVEAIDEYVELAVRLIFTNSSIDSERLEESIKNSRNCSISTKVKIMYELMKLQEKAKNELQQRYVYFNKKTDELLDLVEKYENMVEHLLNDNQKKSKCIACLGGHYSKLKNERDNLKQEKDTLETQYNEKCKLPQNININLDLGTLSSLISDNRRMIVPHEKGIQIDEQNRNEREDYREYTTKITNQKSFRSLIQNVDPDKLLPILHQLIDGKGGKDVGIIIGATLYKYHYLTRYPTEVEFTQEFTNITTQWRAIKNAFKEPHENGRDAFSIDIRSIELKIPE